MASAPLEIRSAHDIVAALNSPELTTRLAICQATAARPAHVLAYGAAAGIDLVEVFIAAARKRETLLLRKATLGAVVHFDDPRVVALFREVLLTSSESDVLRLAARRVAIDDQDESRRFLRERLLNEPKPLRVRCIAGALAGASDLSTAEKLRLVLASGAQQGAVEAWPRAGDESAASWANELNGPFALLARRLLQNAALQADWLALQAFWSRWPDSDRAWFLGWGNELFGSTEPPDVVSALLGEALEQPRGAALLAALRWCACSANAVPAEALLRHAKAHSAELRLAALAALPFAALDWWQVAQTDPEPSVRALAVERALSASDVAGSSRELATLMEDADWRVRAAVVRALNRNESVAVTTARAWIGHASPQVRAGALQILLDHGQERWLMDAFIG
ncbi:MAG: hypothetical protein QM756_01810 [Polyangiaceae bacterium]